MELLLENVAREYAMHREREVVQAMQNRHAITAARARSRNEGAARRIRRLLALASMR